MNVAGPILFTGIALMLAVIAAATLTTGWSLLKRKPWGRTLALVMAFVSLLKPLFGTALGVYTLYVLLPDEARTEYERMAKGNGSSAVEPKPV